MSMKTYHHVRNLWLADAIPFAYAAKPWPDGVYEKSGRTWVDTPTGPHEIVDGDMLLVRRMGDGVERHPCKPKIFAKTFKEGPPPEPEE